MHRAQVCKARMNDIWARVIEPSQRATIIQEKHQPGRRQDTKPSVELDSCTTQACRSKHAHLLPQTGHRSFLFGVKQVGDGGSTGFPWGFVGHELSICIACARARLAPIAGASSASGQRSRAREHGRLGRRCTFGNRSEAAQVPMSQTPAAATCTSQRVARSCPPPNVRDWPGNRSWTARPSAHPLTQLL
jgi:hypothetical protein